MEGWRFPKKAIKEFEKKQELARPVPKEVTLETFTQFLGAGEYRSHYHVSRNGSNRFAENLPAYAIRTFCTQKEAVCPKCKTTSTQLKFYYGVNVLEAKLPGSDKLH